MTGYFFRDSQIIHAIVIKYFSAKNRRIPSCEPITGKYINLGCIGIDWNFIIRKKIRLMYLGHTTRTGGQLQTHIHKYTQTNTHTHTQTHKHTHTNTHTQKVKIGQYDIARYKKIDYYNVVVIL